MPEPGILTDTRYKKLLTDLRKVIQEGKRRAEEAAGQVLVETYWEMGKRISEEKLTENAGYGDSILADLSEDLEMGEDNLRRSVDFFEAFPGTAPRGGNLTWSHYRELLLLPEEAREFYVKEVDKEAWTRDELVSAIRRDLFGQSGSPSQKKKSLRLTRPLEATYVYKALIEKIVDGDTLILRIDLGFQVWKEQRIRLAGIDCPPIDTAKGYEAFEYVRDELARAPFVMVKTHQIDIYGRYVAHLFYSFSEKDKAKVFTEGRYLNQELLDRGLAKLV
jgi:endonuclease YncB( thermonuclease family)